MTKAIAVILPNWIGDAVMATPGLAALRAAAGEEARIVGFGPANVCDLLAGHPALTALEPLPAPVHLPLGRAFALAARLRAGRFDQAVLLSNGLGVALASWLAGIPARIGYDRRNRGVFLTAALQPPREGRRSSPIPAIDYYLALVQTPGAARPAMLLATSPEDEAAAVALLSAFAARRDRPTVILNNSAARSAEKLWPIESMAELARRIARHSDVNLLILAAPGGEDRARETARLADHAHVLAVMPATIGTLKACIRRARLVVSTDSGPRSIAAAFGVRLVALFGPTDPRWTLLHVPNEIMIEARETHSMADISVERVWSAVREHLDPVQAR